MRILLVFPLLLAASPAVAPSIVPGYWEVTSTPTLLDVPGIPRFLAGMMKKPSTTKRCITPEQAAKGPAQMMSGRKNCTVQDQKLDGGAFSVTAICAEKEPGAHSTVHVEGRLAGTSYADMGTIRGSGGKRGDLRIDFTETGRRIGECPAGKAG